MAQNETKTDRCADQRTAQAATAPSLTHGGALVKLLVGIPLALIAALLLAIAFYEGRKAYWDWRVEQMCEKDGGVKILRRVRVSPAIAKDLPKVGGHLTVVTKHAAKDNEPLVSVSQREYLRDSDPEVWRTDVSIVQRVNSEIVGRMIMYTRRGGDLPTFAHPSSLACPDALRLASSLMQNR